MQEIVWFTESITVKEIWDKAGKHDSLKILFLFFCNLEYINMLRHFKDFNSFANIYLRYS